MKPTALATTVSSTDRASKRAFKLGRVSALLALATVASITRIAPAHADASSTSSPGFVPVGARHANGAPSNGEFGMGAVSDPKAQKLSKAPAHAIASLPASVDLSQYDPPVGNQNGLNSCAAWAISNLRAWYARRDGYYPGSNASGTYGFAPMYSYSQIVNGQNIGTTFSDNLNILQGQGVDTRMDYWQGDSDYKDLPTSSERLNADQYKISSSWVFSNTGYPYYLQPYIENNMSADAPIDISIPVYQNFTGFRGGFYSGPSGKYLGNHAVMAVAYDSNGLWIENSWGTGWGYYGYAELSWSFVNNYGQQIAAMLPAPMKNRFQQVQGDEPYVYVLGSDGKLWREYGNASHRNQVDGSVAAFQAVHYPTVYVLGTDHNLWRETPDSSNRSQVDGYVQQFQALDATTVYVLGTDGKLWRETGSSPNRTQVDSNVAEFQALDATTVYVKRWDSSLWREIGNSSNASWVDGNVESFQALDSTTVYVLGMDGNLWREYGSSSNRNQVDSYVQSFAAANSATVYVEQNTGWLWVDTGNSSNRNYIDNPVAEFQPVSNGNVLVLSTNGTLYIEEPNAGSRYWVDSSV